MSGDSVDVDKELLPFLSASARHDLKFFAIKHFVGKFLYIIGPKKFAIVISWFLIATFSSRQQWCVFYQLFDRSVLPTSSVYCVSARMSVDRKHPDKEID